MLGKDNRTTHGPAVSGVSLFDLLQAGLVLAGDVVTFKGERSIVTADGALLYTRRAGTPERFTSLSKWAKEVALLQSKSKHYSGWVHCILDRLQRPLEHLRQKFWHEKQGLSYTLPPMDKKRRREDSALDTEQRKILAATDPSALQNGNIPTAQFDFVNRQSRDVENAFAGAGCEHPICPLCNRTQTRMIGSTWSDILQVVLETLSQIYPQKEYFALSDDIYAFIDVHWNLLCTKPRSAAWRQTCKMTLAHSRYNHLFENGYDKLMKTGFWRLKPAENRSASPAAPSSPSSNGGSSNAAGDEFQPTGEAQTLALMEHQYNFRRRGRTVFDDMFTDPEALDNLDDTDSSVSLDRSSRIKSVYSLSGNSSPASSRRRRPSLMSGPPTPSQRDTTASDEEMEDSGSQSGFSSDPFAGTTRSNGKSMWVDLYDFFLTADDKSILASIDPSYNKKQPTDAEKRAADLLEENIRVREDLLSEQQARLQMMKEFAESSARMSDMQVEARDMQEEAKMALERSRELEESNFSQQREIDALLGRIGELTSQLDERLVAKQYEDKIRSEEERSEQLAKRVAELESELAGEKRRSEAAEKALHDHQTMIVEAQQKYFAMMQMYKQPLATGAASAVQQSSSTVSSSPSSTPLSSSGGASSGSYPAHGHSYPVSAPWMHSIMHGQQGQPSLAALLS